MARRVAALLGIGTVTWLLGIIPAVAAMPGFEWNVDARDDSIEVTVTFEPVPFGFAWHSLESSGALGELVGVVRPDEVGQAGRPISGADPILLDLQRISTGVYGATANAASGEWAVVVWPLVGEFPRPQPGVPDTELVTVGRTSDFSAGAWVPLVAGAAVIAVVGALWLRRFRQAVDP